MIRPAGSMTPVSPVLPTRSTQRRFSARAIDALEEVLL